MVYCVTSDILYGVILCSTVRKEANVVLCSIWYMESEKLCGPAADLSETSRQTLSLPSNLSLLSFFFFIYKSNNCYWGRGGEGCSAKSQVCIIPVLIWRSQSELTIVLSSRKTWRLTTNPERDKTLPVPVLAYKPKQRAQLTRNMPDCCSRPSCTQAQTVASWGNRPSYSRVKNNTFRWSHSKSHHQTSTFTINFSTWCHIHQNSEVHPAACSTENGDVLISQSKTYWVYSCSPEDERDWSWVLWNVSIIVFALLKTSFCKCWLTDSETHEKATT